MNVPSGYRMSRSMLLLQAAGVALLAAPAQAQTTAAAPTEQAAEPAEIVVTATKRAESVQAVPLSISALNSSTLRTQGVHDFSRLDLLVPGLKFGQSGNDARPAIRGTRTQQVIGNADPVVAFYIDGVYRSRPGQQLSIFYDVERIEVARGPQGTLFGRNSFGGAINVISKAPVLGQLDIGGAIEATNYSGLRGEGFVNVPLGDVAALRISGYSAKRDGWVKNSTNLGNDLHDDDNQLIRGQLKIAPGSRFTNVLRVEYWHGGGAGPGDFGYYTSGIPYNPATGRTNGVSGVIDPVISPVSYRNGGYDGLPVGTRGDGDIRSISRNLPFQRRVSQTSVSDEANLDLSFATLRGIFGYADYKERRLGDPDYSSTARDAAYNQVTAQTGTEEIQLVSNGTGAFTWVVGAYFLQDKSTDLYVFGDDQTGRTPTQSTYGIPGVISTISGQNRPYNIYVQGPFAVVTNSTAFYGDGTYEILPGLKLLGGVRWTQDRRKATIDNVPFAGSADYGSPNGIEGPQRRTFEKVTWRAGAQYQIVRRSMVYGTYSTGFVAGGFSGAPSFSTTGSSLSTYNPTTDTAIEIGSKNTFLDGKLRFNIAAYRNVYNNLVTQRLVQVGNAISTTTANAGTIRSWGVEAEIDYYPSSASYIGLRLNGAHARFGNYVAGNSFSQGSNIAGVNSFQLNGAQVPLNPDFTGTLIGSYDLDTGKTGVLTPSATVYYSTKYRTSDQPYFFANQKDYATVDLALRWKPERDSKLAVQLFVSNLTDKQVLLRTTPNAGSVIYQDFSNPRFFGGRISFNY